MTVLLLRLAGPLQSWGSASRFSRRETEAFPTKSGVIGLIAAALGVRRNESLAQFEGLRFGVRIDQSGTLLRDFHTAHNERGDSMPLSHRFYLQDAVFLAAIEDSGSDRPDRYRQALQNPYFPLFLGRRSCPPDGPVQTWIREDGLEEALSSLPWVISERQQCWVLRWHNDSSHRKAEIIVEDSSMDDNEPSDGFVNVLNDEPVSFDPRNRQWTSRPYRRLGFVEPSPTVDIRGDGPIPVTPESVHNPMQAVLDATKGDA